MGVGWVEISGFKNGGNALASTDAEGDEGAFVTAGFHLAKGCQRQSRSAGSHWMA